MKKILLPALVAGLLVSGQFAAGQSTRSSASGSGRTATTTTRKKAVKKAVKKPPPVDPTDGDNVDGDDLTVRRAAVSALGTTNGSVLVVDPNSGRVLTLVNQKLGLKAGFTPCSTIKLVTALAALSEHVVERDTVIRLSRVASFTRSEEHTSELQSLRHLVCRLLLEKKESLEQVDRLPGSFRAWCVVRGGVSTF